MQRHKILEQVKANFKRLEPDHTFPKSDSGAFSY